LAGSEVLEHLGWQSLASFVLPNRSWGRRSSRLPARVRSAAGAGRVLKLDSAAHRRRYRDWGK